MFPICVIFIFTPSHLFRTNKKKIIVQRVSSKDLNGEEIEQRVKFESSDIFTEGIVNSF